MRYRSKKQRKPMPLTATVSLDSARHPYAATGACGESHPAGEPCNCVRVKQQLSDALAEKQNQQQKLQQQLVDTKAHSRSESRLATSSAPSLADAFDASTVPRKPHQHQPQHAASFDAPSVASLPSSSSSGKASAVGHGKLSYPGHNQQLLEVKMYNTKTLPKRIATLKKQRAKTACGPAKETFKFYMDFGVVNSADATVLRITESTEDLTKVPASVERPSTPAAIAAVDSSSVDQSAAAVAAAPAIPARSTANADVAIISDLLMTKHHRQFDRMLRSKPPKKQLSLDQPTAAQHQQRRRASSGTLLSLLPEPPAVVRSLSFADADMAAAGHKRTATATSPRDIIIEPIYESLLRNVHVPYKFSPILSRSISQPHYRFAVQSPARPPKPKLCSLQSLTTLRQRPNKGAAVTTDATDDDDEDDDDDGEDYVRLEYSEQNGALERVDGEVVPPRQTATAAAAAVQQPSDLFRNSDSNINYNRCDATAATPMAATDQLSSPSTPHAVNFGEDMIDNNRRLSDRSCNASFSSLQNPTPTSLQQPPATSLSAPHALRKSRSGADSKPLQQHQHLRPFTLIHRQGSESLGSRIAHLDYADPRTLFAFNRRPSATASESEPPTPPSQQQQRDSAVGGSTSSLMSADSYHTANGSGDGLVGDSFYEQSVEDLLENSMYAATDASRRDSAIYSGDEVHPKQQQQLQRVSCSVTPPVALRPLLMPATPSKPALPKKPASLRSPVSPVAVDRREQSPSWVLRQIKNFDQ